MLLRQIKGAIWLFQCDWCEKEFEASLSRSKQQRQCCSRSCGSKASRQQVRETLTERYGVINAGQMTEVKQRVKNTCIERYGVEYSWQSEKVKTQIKETMMERYGVEHNMHSETLKNKLEKTNLQRYGTKSSFGSKEVRNKITDTLIERYGVDNPQKNHEIRSKTKLTNLERYGAESPFQSKEIQLKMRNNCLTNYGVEYTFQREDVKQQIKQTMFEKYGAEYPMQIAEFQKKAINTFLLKGKGFVSSSELKCLMILREIFGFELVEHQVAINRWLIDFYVKPVDTYVQFDGAYWHGLNRDKELLEAPISKRDYDISRKWYRDREQELWFMNNNLKLIRIDERDFEKWKVNGCIHDAFIHLMNNKNSDTLR